MMSALPLISGAPSTIFEKMRLIASLDGCVTATTVRWRT
jgi:hypothetical protein